MLIRHKHRQKSTVKKWEILAAASMCMFYSDNLQMSFIDKGYNTEAVSQNHKQLEAAASVTSHCVSH